jgi:hypothetical protein
VRNALHVVFSLNLPFIPLTFSLVLCLLAIEQELDSSVIMLHGVQIKKWCPVLIMATKWKCLDLNMKCEIVCL